MTIYDKFGQSLYREGLLPGKFGCTPCWKSSGPPPRADICLDCRTQHIVEVTARMRCGDAVRYTAVSHRRDTGGLWRDPVQASPCRLPPWASHRACSFSVTTATSRQCFCPGTPIGVSAPQVLIALQAGTLCLAHTEVSGSQEESRRPAHTTLLVQAVGHSEPRPPANGSRARAQVGIPGRHRRAGVASRPF